MIMVLWSTIPVLTSHSKIYNYRRRCKHETITGYLLLHHIKPGKVAPRISVWSQFAQTYLGVCRIWLKVSCALLQHFVQYGPRPHSHSESKFQDYIIKNLAYRLWYSLRFSLVLAGMLHFFFLLFLFLLMFRWSWFCEELFWYERLLPKFTTVMQQSIMEPGIVRHEDVLLQLISFFIP